MPANLPIQWLRSFIAVAELGSGIRAAREAGISQPTVSLHIGKLEETLGRTLIDRRRSLRLSKAGKALLPRARHVVGLHDDLFLDEAPVEDVVERQRAKAVSLLKDALDELEGRHFATADRS